MFIIDLLAHWTEATVIHTMEQQCFKGIVHPNMNIYLQSIMYYDIPDVFKWYSDNLIINAPRDQLSYCMPESATMCSYNTHLFALMRYISISR